MSLARRRYSRAPAPGGRRDEQLLLAPCGLVGSRDSLSQNLYSGGAHDFEQRIDVSFRGARSEECRLSTQSGRPARCL